ncbi:serpin family protein [Paenibacillus silviterrae]|uniref:serpin family protein n=1 Tax=Paenibacillus silviterrae TaxID=3242194 RepID=UPI002543DC14|nr:serpin family protein [Paenibacillus chinjuensis]
MRIRNTGAVLAFVLLAACTSPFSKPAVSYKERQLLASALEPPIVQASNSFGLRLHKQLSESKPETNVILSPVSLSTAMAMTYNGSEGETKAAMATFLGWQDLPLEQLNGGYKKLEALLREPGSRVKLNTANSLWLNNKWKFHDSFLDTVRSSYEAEVRSLDLQGKNAVGTINGWVNKKTNHRIPSLLTNPLPPEAVMVLVNAISFQGGWKHEFDPSLTREGVFKLAGGGEKKVPLMSLGQQLEYLETDEAEAVRLPYGDGQMAMLLIVPKEGVRLDAVQAKLRQDPTPWQQRYPAIPGDLRLPKFKAEYGAELREELEAMGMKLPFDRTKADFSAMAPSPPNLFIGQIVHKTFLEVNEKGTEAAAATAVLMEAGSAPPKQRFSLTVDRPFFFAIEDRQTGAWLFMGSIYEPMP